MVDILKSPSACRREPMTQGYQALRDDAAWFDVSARARIRVTGEDRSRLLHALATNVIEGLEPGQSTQTFFLSPRGRIQARCAVYIGQGDVLLETDSASRQRLIEYLNGYIIMDDVVLDDVTDSTAAAAIEGPGAEEAVRKVLAGLAFTASAAPSALSGQVGLRLVADRDQAAPLTDALVAAAITTASAADVERMRVRRRRPLHGVDYTESNIPHETQLLDLVSFSKGCYVGQEIVERVKAQGRVNRLLVAVEAKTDATPEDLTLRLGERVVGTLTSPTLFPESGELLGFALIRREAMEAADKVRLGDLELEQSLAFCRPSL